MTEVRTRAIALAMATLLSLFSSTFPAQAALPGHPGCKPSDAPRGAVAPPGSGELACLSGAERVDLQTRPAFQALIPPLAREQRLQSALLRWKAREAQALAVPRADGQDALAAYLEGRELESLRSQALKETEAAIVQAEARILQLGVDLRAATTPATRWISRQPGRGVPAAYLERIMVAADAILTESAALRAHYAQRDALNRHFDDELERVLTMQG